MNTVKCIQYVARHSDEGQAKDVLTAVKQLAGFLGGRVTRSPDLEHRDSPWVCQAFFSCHEDINPLAVGSCFGLRVVLCPLDMLANINRDQNP